MKGGSLPIGTGAPESARESRSTRAAFTAVLLALSVVSIMLVTTVDDAAYGLLSRGMGHSAGENQFLPVIFWLVRARMASCIVCGVLWIAVNVMVRPEPSGQTHWQRASWVAMAWLIGTVVAVYGVGVYVPALPRPEDVAAFMGFGLVAEELLFRGAIFSLCRRVFPAHAMLPIVWTSLLFGLQHLQYHHFHADAHALTQVAYTIPMGVVLGYVRSRTGHLWPAVVVHVLNNAATVMRVA